jgi:hypothetical protein
MKQRFYLSLIYGCIFLAGFSALASPVDYKHAKAAASGKLISLGKSSEFSLVDKENIFSAKGNNALFYIFTLKPLGYIVLSSDNDLPPVIAYSFTNDAGGLDSDSNILIRILKADLIKRFENIPEIPERIIQQRRDEWQALTANKSSKKVLQQWPPQGTTSTGGWLQTNWTQDGIYDDMCPMDPVTNQRSYAGCPATAMAQILNYYQTTNNTQFTDADDYYHSYAGRNYQIDDDHAARDFPSFPVLNAHLDTVSSCFANNGILKNHGKAALTFACGVAAHQVYSSQGSGTFGVSQAVESYQRFGFSGISFFEGTDSTLYDTLSQNMKDARPAHLAIVDPGWTTGHNVVVDGYNTDEYYHLNFGWGGTYNGWYLLPDEIPYGLTVIEGLIASIAYPPLHIGISNSMPENRDLQLNIYPNPASDKITAVFNAANSSVIEIEIYNLKGNLLFSIPLKTVVSVPGVQSVEIPLGGPMKLAKGLYLCKFSAGDISETKSFIIQ